MRFITTGQSTSQSENLFYRILSRLDGDIDDFFEQKHPVLYGRVSKCHLVFCTIWEIKEFEKENIELSKRSLEICRNSAVEILQKHRGKDGTYPDYTYDELSEIVETIIGWEEIPSSEKNKEIISRLDELRKESERDSAKTITGWEKFPSCEKDSSGDISGDIDILIDNLRNLYIPSDLLGCYVRETRTIYLCLDRIDQESQKSNVQYEFLAISVLVHEYAHHLHYEYIEQRQRHPVHVETEVQRSAVFETIAEYVQLSHAQYLKNHDLLVWIEHHITSGVFPGWGYAGAGILYEMDKHLPRKAFTAVLETSKHNWREAYLLMVGMELLLG